MDADEARCSPDPEGDPEREDERAREGNGQAGHGHGRNGHGANGKPPLDDWDTLRRFNGFKAGDPEARDLFCRHDVGHFRRVIAAHPLLP